MISPLLLCLLVPQGSPAPLLAEVHRALPGSYSGSNFLVSVDVDGNGAPDVISGRSRSRLALNDGGGVFEDASEQLPIPGGNFIAGAGGDVDGNGYPDLVLLASGVQLWTNDAGTFSNASANLPPVAAGVQSIALFDVEGDGDLDLFLGGFPAQLFFNDGAGLFVANGASLPLTPSGSHSTAFGDVDADGDGDLVLGSSNRDALWLNDGTGAFTDTPGRLPPPNPSKTGAAALLGDVDGDADLDIVKIRSFGSAPPDEDVWLNDGAGFFALGPTIPDAGQQDSRGILFDADGDGDLDLYVDARTGCRGLQSCLLYRDRLVLNDGTGVFTPSTFAPLYKETYGTVAADVDQDGDQDLLVASDDDELYLSDGGGGFVLASLHPALPDVGTVYSIEIRDFDADGVLDAFLPGNPEVLLPGAPGGNALLLGVPGLGLVDASSKLPANLSPAFDADAGDLDGDGDVDVFLGAWPYSSPPPAPHRVLVNDGAARFQVDTDAVPSSPNVVYDVLLGDLDADGDLDAVEASLFGGEVAVLFNDGRHLFTRGPALPPPFRKESALAAGDFDLDGDLDLLGSGADGDHLILNEGSGVFADASANLPAAPGVTLEFAVGDVDGDGDPDVLGAVTFGSDRLLLNDGTAVFIDATANLPPPDVMDSAVTLVDVDGDGDLDALGGTSFTPDTLLENDGQGVFTLRPELLVSNDDETLAFGVADLDDDGDQDVLVGNTQATERLWTNLTRQVARRNVIGVGKRAIVDLRGPSGGTVLLAVAPDTARIPTKFGTLRLSPASLQNAGAFALDADGVAAAAFLVPADPQLVGLTLWMQGLIGPPLRFSNLEELAITAY